MDCYNEDGYPTEEGWILEHFIDEFFTEFFENWMTRIIETEKPSCNIAGYYFKLVESGFHKYILYLSGSSKFEMDNNNWIYNNDFEPKDKYLHLPQYKNWELKDVLLDIVSDIKSFIDTDIYKKSFFSKSKIIAVGFDNENIIFILP